MPRAGPARFPIAGGSARGFAVMVEAIGPEFFERCPIQCARELVGAHFHWDGRAGRIVETEAYLAVDDPACHTWSRPGARAFVETHAAGDAYVYLNYGVHWLFNVLVKGPAGDGFVLFRALEPLPEEPGNHAIAAGPGKLTRFIGIDGSAHGATFLGGARRKILHGGPIEVCTGVRIGISKATDFPWRFGDPASPSLSRRF